MLRAMVRMNPQLNELMEQRPEIARMLEDPELLQQSMRRTVAVARKRWGGHNALVRAHEEFADPLFEAMSGGSGTNTSTTVVDYSDTSSAPNNEALPNPWGPPTQVPSTSPAPTPARPGMGMGLPTAPTGFGSPATEPSGSGVPMLSGVPMPAWGSGTGINQLPAPYAGGPFMPGQFMTGASPTGLSGMPPPPNGMPGWGGLGPPASYGTPPAFNFSAMMNAMNAMNTMGQQTAPGTTGTGTAPTASPAAAANPMNRIRFASQLAQLSSMGFTNEAACLRALARHEGRVDAAIDALLAGDEDNQGGA
eukprot:Skav209361  [mRNA]  locus=scaffold1388:73401:78590:- [translate_table: standard]